jgi:diaminohydroxyphosphoribosylaminopyrimidine deaminase/5-amino-6-(5-phosphoribosylamino)uracil reductase
MDNHEKHPAEKYMRRALELGILARGRTSPNPAVGAVVVTADGQIAGEGFTQPPGQAHAEVVALAEAGGNAMGGTLFVTLEPCASYGRTPPCTEAIIRAGVTKVHYAVPDPNPKMRGGAEVLHEAGIEVICGPLEGEAAQAHEAFFHWLKTGRPFVIIKYAMTLDGKIATSTGDSRWVTGAEARQAVHRLRDECDAILVGVNTVLADNPELTTRLPDDSINGRTPRNPFRIILDSRGRLPLTAKVVQPGTLVATSNAMLPATKNELETRGVEVITFPADKYGRVEILPVLAELGKRGFLQLLVEGGSLVMSSFLFGNPECRANKVWAFIAPKIAGGVESPGPVGGSGVQKMAEALPLKRLNIGTYGQDILVEGYLED